MGTKCLRRKKRKELFGQYSPVELPNDGMVFSNFCWIYKGWLLREEASNRTVRVSMDDRVEVFDERVMCNNDMSYDSVEPVIFFSCIFCVCIKL